MTGPVTADTPRWARGHRREVVEAGTVAELIRRRLRRGEFNSVGALIEAIETWAEHWNDDPRPFSWHTSAQEIIAKVQRGRAARARTKSATRH